MAFQGHICASVHSKTTTIEPVKVLLLRQRGYGLMSKGFSETRSECVLRFETICPP